MELLNKIRRPRVAAAAVLLSLTGCTTIHENNDIADCKRQGLIEATTDPRKDGYDKATDPAVLAKVMFDRAEKQMEEDMEDWNNVYSSQVVGIGEIACMGEDDKLYLNVTGSQLSTEYRENN